MRSTKSTGTEALFDFSRQSGTPDKGGVPSHANSSPCRAPYRDVGSSITDIIKPSFSKRFVQACAPSFFASVQRAPHRRREPGGAEGAAPPPVESVRAKRRDRDGGPAPRVWLNVHFRPNTREISANDAKKPAFGGNRSRFVGGY